jgi:hypothetical protein
MKQIKVRVHDETLWNDFKEFVEDKHQRDYGVTGLELERALYLFLKHEKWGCYADSEKSNQGRDPQGNCTHKKLKPRQIKFLKSYDLAFKDADIIKDNTLIDFIKDELNVIDKRAVDGWITFLKVKHWIIKIPREHAWKNNFPHLTWETDILQEA